MSDFYSMLLSERKELAEKIISGVTFLLTENGMRLPAAEYEDLSKQLAYMRAYHDALMARIRFYSARQGDS